MSRTKTEYLQVGGMDQGTELHMQEEVVKKVEHFKYLGSVVSGNGRSEEVVRIRVQAGWQNWRRTTGVPCDKKLSPQLKGTIYRCVVRPAMLCSMETVAMTERLERKMETAELKMMRWALGVTLKDRIKTGTSGGQLGSGEWERSCEVRDCGGTGM